MERDELCFTPATELARLIGQRALSPVELVDAVLARIRRVNPRVNAFCTIAEEPARAAARSAEARIMAGDLIGPLAGLPVAIKDLAPTAGIRTTFGSKMFEHHVPAEDAAVVARLKAAGAIVVGKTNTPEFGCKGVTDNRIFGITRNPWNLAMTAGGSSGGSAAALAAGMAPLAEGSDIAGSIRIPAAMCGVVGLKPSPGRVPRFPNTSGWNSLGVNGPMARTVRDTALLFGAMSGFDERDPLSLPPTGEDFLASCDESLGPLRMAWSPDLGHAAVDPEVVRVASAAAGAFSALGCNVEEASPELGPVDDLFLQLTAPLRAAAVGRYLGDWAPHMDPILVARVRLAETLSAVDHERLQQRRTELWQAMVQFFRRYALLLTPTVALPPFPVDAQYPPAKVAGVPATSPVSWMPFTVPFNLTGHPAISVPAGWTRAGLPVGLQIVGPRLAESALFRAAAALEMARPWHHLRPPLSRPEDSVASGEPAAGARPL